MLNISNIDHRLDVQKVRNAVFNAMEHKDPRDLTAIDAANEQYIKAKTDYVIKQSDFTMVNLNGAWARLNRVMMEIEEKYGVRR